MHTHTGLRDPEASEEREQVWGRCCKWRQETDAEEQKASRFHAQLSSVRELRSASLRSRIEVSISVYAMLSYHPEYALRLAADTKCASLRHARRRQ